MNNQTRFPKAVEFLRNAMLGKEGFDLAFAQELTQLVSTLGQKEAQIEQLKAENDTLIDATARLAAELADYNSQSSAPVTPQFPDDFYVYGDSPMSYRPSDEEVQDMIDDLYDAELEDGQFAELSTGDTLVIKTKDSGVVKIIVVQGYAENVISEDEDEDESCCGDPYPYCSDCPGDGGFGF